jgi:hypothetical protein
MQRLLFLTWLWIRHRSIAYLLVVGLTLGIVLRLKAIRFSHGLTHHCIVAHQHSSFRLKRLFNQPVRSMPFRRAEQPKIAGKTLNHQGICRLLRRRLSTILRTLGPCFAFDLILSTLVGVLERMGRLARGHRSFVVVAVAPLLAWPHLFTRA